VKNGEAAVAVPLQGSAEVADPIPPTFTTPPKASKFRKRPCSHPSAAATPPHWHIYAGEVVLDLGSGGGIDVLLSAKRVGPTGKAYVSI